MSDKIELFGLIDSLITQARVLRACNYGNKPKSATEYGLHRSFPHPTIKSYPDCPCRT